jgi:hypothetical protein
MEQLNAVIEKILHNWMVIVKFYAEVDFCFASDEPDLTRDEVIGYSIKSSFSGGFGKLVISDDGEISSWLKSDLGDHIKIITAPMNAHPPRPLLDIFLRHCSSEILDANLNHIGLVAVMHFEYHFQFYTSSYLENAARTIRLDAFTETMIRPSTAALMEDLMPYVPWFDYAAVLANNIVDKARRVQLIADMNLLLCYLSLGHNLNFPEMTSLCDVAGSLQPVRSLIQKKMPALII